MRRAEVNAFWQEYQRIFITEFGLSAKCEHWDNGKRGNKQKTECDCNGEERQAKPVQARRTQKVSPGARENDNAGDIETQVKVRRIMRSERPDVIALGVPE